MTKATTTIQISVYDWKIEGELIYEAQIRSIEEMVSLSYQFGSKVKYKKTTDKCWYTFREITKRLFKEKVNKSHVEVKLVIANDLKEFIEENKQFKNDMIMLQKQFLINDFKKQEIPDFNARTPHGFGVSIDRA